MPAASANAPKPTTEAGAPGISSRDALLKLGSVLYWHLQRYNLEDDCPDWEQLSEHQHAMYVKCVEAILREDRLIAAVNV